MDLISCCRNRNIKLAWKLLDEPDININKQNMDGTTALMWSCINSLTDIAFKILSFPNIDVNIKNNYGYTALIFACSRSNEDVALKILAKDNVDYYAKVFYNTDTAIFHAKYYNMTNVLNKMGRIAQQQIISDNEVILLLGRVIQVDGMPVYDVIIEHILPKLIVSL